MATVEEGRKRDTERERERERERRQTKKKKKKQKKRDETKEKKNTGVLVRPLCAKPSSSGLPSFGWPPCVSTHTRAIRVSPRWRKNCPR